MIKLKTKTPFLVPYGRGTKSVVVRMITSHFSLIDFNNIKVEGYFYYLSDENDINSVVKLPNSDFGQNSMKRWEDIISIENMENSPLSDLISNRNLKTVLMQRLKEVTMIQLIQEGYENYGTQITDWEDDV